MAKYSKATGKKVESAMKRFKKGTLRSGSTGKKVVNPKQAIAIGISEAKKKITKAAVKKAIIVKKKTVTVKPVTQKNTPKGGRRKNVIASKKSIKKSSPIKPVKKSPVKKSASVRSIVNKKIAALKKVPVKTALKKIAKKPIEKTNPQKGTIIEAVPITVSSIPVQDITNTIKTIDPVIAFDKHSFEKATTKGDPTSKIQLSNISKGSIKPSGKKPLWRK